MLDEIEHACSDGIDDYKSLSYALLVIVLFVSIYFIRIKFANGIVQFFMEIMWNSLTNK